MQSTNSCHFNIYTLLSNVIRLLLLAICLFLGFLTLACSNPQQTQQLNIGKRPPTIKNAIDLNLVTAEELERLPKIGKGIAQRIIEFREKNGKFRRAEHLILVRGMSDKKFREIQNLVKVE